MKFSVPALLALAGVAGLAFFPPDGPSLAGAQMGPDRTTLWFLLVCAFIAMVPPLFARLRASRDGSTWALICVFFLLFHLADRAGPSDGWKLTLPFAPDDPLAISYATRVVVVGALLSLPLWLRRGGPEKAIIVALAGLSVFSLGMLWFLGHYYSLEDIAPRSVTTLLGQAVAYSALALCCRAATEDERVRVWALRALPPILLLVVLRHQLAPIPAPKDDQ